MADPWYVVENVAEIDSPALLVYPDRAEENIRRMIAYAGGVERLRPHVKTHKMSQIIDRQIAAGIHKYKCATIAEAEMVAACGAFDVFLSYQVVGPKVQRFAALAKKYPGVQFSCLQDDEQAIRAFSAGLAEAGVTGQVLLDMDNGFSRTGIAPGPRAAELYRLVNELPAIEPGGLHVYDGQFRQQDLEERCAASDAAFAPVLEFRQQLEAEGLPVPRVVAGGTPTFPCHARRPDVECSPGTCIFWDASYADKFRDLDFLNAAVLLTRVISKPGEDRLSLDLGYKAVSPDNPDPRVVLFGLSDAKALVHNEEHLTIATSQAGRYQVGDVLYGIPFHICPTVALHQNAVVIENGRATQRWDVVARDRCITV